MRRPVMEQMGVGGGGKSRVTEKFLGVKAWAGEDKVAQKEGNEKIVCWAVVPTFQIRHGMPRVKLRLPVKTTVWISILGYVVPNLKVFPSISPSLVLSEAQLSMVVEQKRFFSRARTGDTYCTSKHEKSGFDHASEVQTKYSPCLIIQQS